jgi:N6-adenosine-specific RNA methylase IME4
MSKTDDEEKLMKSLLSMKAGRFNTLLADPPWRFANRTGKMAPEHRRLKRYRTMDLQEIMALPVARLAAEKSHLYLWVPNALLAEGLAVMKAWGFTYKSNLVWLKIRKDGGPDGRGVGFYFRNVTELVLFGIRGRIRTLAPGRRQVNMLATRKEEHSKKPVEMYEIIEACSPGPRLELFARDRREGWHQWGDQVGERRQLSQTNGYRRRTAIERRGMGFGTSSEKSPTALEAGASQLALPLRGTTQV